jgi:competence protein ComEC
MAHPRSAQLSQALVAALAERTAALAARARAQLAAERERWFLWLPVALGTGIGIYFALPSEPPLWLGPLLLLIAIAATLAWRRAPALPLLLGAAAVAAGLVAAQLRTASIEAPVLAREGVHELEGRVVLVEDRVQGHRIVIEDPVIEDLAPEATPERVRIALRSGGEGIRPGDHVRLLAMLMPPSGPSVPGGFDFARQAYFERLGAVGFAYGAPHAVDPGPASSYALWLAGVRQAIAGRVGATLDGATGAVATALLTGLRGAIPEEVWHDMQIAGLAHLLAISGLHVGLVAGAVFLIVRYGLLLTPWAGPRWPVKKIAAAGALVAAFAYMQLAGAPIPTQRAVLMAALALLAVMVDRNPLSMRLVAWAAIVILLLAPESLLGASFQMSFAAVIGLIAAYETGRARLRPPGEAGLAYKLALYVVGVAITTVIASTVTAPISAYHFQRIATFAIIANLVAVPVTAFWIMPAGLMALLSMPLGLEGPLLAVMGGGVDVVLWTANASTRLPAAAIEVRQWPTASLVAFALGGLWLCLWQRPWRLFGLAGAVIGMLFAAADRPPDVLVADGGDLIAVRGDDGRLMLSPWRRDSYTTGDWLRRSGYREPAEWPEVGLPGPLACDRLGCVLRRNGHAVAFARDSGALAEDCRIADLVVSFAPADACGDRSRLIRLGELMASGGLALWLEPAGPRVLRIEDTRGDRPWTR